VLPSESLERSGSQGQATARRLIEATRQCLVEKGHAACSVKAIAAAAGVNHGLVHHYFGSKEGLFSALLDDMDREIGLQLDNSQDPRELQAFLLEIVFEKARLLNEIYAMARQYPQVRERFVGFMAERRRQIGKALGLDDEIPLRLFTAMVQGMAMQSQVERNLPLYSLVEGMVRLFQPES
jgi:AcrR family transcriptional regulator